MLVVKQVNDTTVDVFHGNGWNNWTRFNVERIKGRLNLKMVKGLPMPKDLFKQLYEVLS